MSMHPAERAIRDAIAADGAIPFHRFMSMALYAPEGGYYRSDSPVGAGGDYFTSPTAHPLFGALLATQLRQMWELLGRPARFTAVEPGAGSGVLARDILRAARDEAPDFADALRYLALDYAAAPQPTLRAPVAPPAADDDAPPAADYAAADGVPARGVVGCILTNELLDALPVHRFVVNGGAVREVYVELDAAGGFREVLGAPSTPAAAERLAAVGGRLPEGYRGEVRPSAAAWLTAAAGALDRGYLLTIDYGGTAAELYAPERRAGTLRCHYRHVVTGNPYVRVGAQDITAHVDFTHLRDAGAACGLSTAGYATQRDFLRNLGADTYLEGLSRRARPQPTYASGAMPRQEALANGMAVRSLLAPEGLGGFRVLAQAKGAPAEGLWGFDDDNPHRCALQSSAATLRVPLLTPSHTPLMAGKYPHLGDPGSEPYL